MSRRLSRSVQQSILAASARGDAEGILSSLQPEISPINVATAAHRLAKLRPTGSLRERCRVQLRLPIQANLRELEPQGTANILWALAVLHGDLPLGRAAEQLTEFSGRHLSNVAWALAKALCREGPLVLQLSGQVAAKAMELSPQSLANLLWSFAYLVMWENLDELAESVAGTASALSPRDLSNTLWALSNGPKIMDCKELLTKLACATRGQASSLHPNDLTSIAWSFVDATPVQMRWLRRGCSGVSANGKRFSYEPVD